ncbi:MAG: DUF4403 family protein [Chlorobiales bacterium]|nr:DUF4403 family protein [Chlorobiales bacterium]
MYKIDVPPSIFIFNITYGVNNLADYLNKKINGSFFKKRISLQKNKKEEITITLTKNNNIVVQSKGKELICTFPVTVDAKLEESRLGGLFTSLVKPVHTSLIITFSTPVAIDKKWCIVTRFKVKSYKWVETPVLQIGPFKKNIESRVDEVINKNSDALAVMLDKEIYKAATLKPTFLKIWSDLQQPIFLSSKPSDVWVKFICNDIKGKIFLTPKNITCATHVQAQMLILTDTTSGVKQNPLPEFKALKRGDRDDKSNVYLYACTSFEEINTQLNKLLKGKTFSEKGHTLTIKGVHAYSSTSGLSVRVITDKNDDLVASGHLVYDVPTQTLQVQNFDFALTQKSRFINIKDDFFHDRIRDAIAKKLTINLDTLIGKVPIILNKAIANEKAGQVIDVNFNKIQIKECLVIMGKEKIHLIVNIGVNADLNLKKIQTGKVIRINDNHNHR